MLVQLGLAKCNLVWLWRSNQSILKEISPGCSFEGLMLKRKLQYLGNLMCRVDSFEKTLMLGGIGAAEGDDRGWDGVTDSMDMSLSELRVLVMDREAWHAAIHGVAKSRTWLSNWTELKQYHLVYYHNPVIYIISIVDNFSMITCLGIDQKITFSGL